MSFARTRIRRQANPQMQHRSINHYDQQGKHTQQTVIPLNGLTMRRRTVQSIVRGDHISNSPLHETRPCSVSAGRCPIFARSGNDDGQHNRPGEEHAWGLVGDLTPAEIEAQKPANPTKAIAVGAVGFAALLWMFAG